jgi:hypothetical protein
MKIAVEYYATDRAGMPQRWHAAIVGILLPFSSIISIKRTSWPRPTFWTSLGGCFVLNFSLDCELFRVCSSGCQGFRLDMVGASSVCPDSRNAIPPAQAGENLESQVSMASDAKAACRGVPQSLVFGVCPA